MKQRIITAVVAAMIFLPITFIGGLPFVILIYLMASIALNEILRMRKIQLLSFPGILSLILLWIFLLPTKYMELFPLIGQNDKIQMFFLGILIFLIFLFLVKTNFPSTILVFPFFNVYRYRLLLHY